MSTFSILERDDDLSEEVTDVCGAMAFLLQGTEGMVTPLWEIAAIWSEAGARGLADGLPTTVVDGAAFAKPMPW